METPSNKNMFFLHGVYDLPFFSKKPIHHGFLHVSSGKGE